MTLLDAAVLELLNGTGLAHLATVLRDGAPHTVPVWVGVEDGRIVVFKEEGTVGLRNVRRDPRVALTVVDGDDPYRYCNVRGVVAGERSGQEAVDCLQRLAVAYTGRPYPTGMLQPGVVLEIEPRRVSLVEIDGFA